MAIDFENLTNRQRLYLERESKKNTDDRRENTATVVAQYIRYKEQKEDDKPGRVSGSALLPVLQGLTLGSADEILAGVSTGFGKLGNYDERLEQIRNAEDEFRELYPGQAIASEIGGGILGFGKLGAAAKAARLPQILRGAGGTTVGGKALRSIVPGTLGGGAYGYLSGEGVNDRVQDALLGAGAGAVVSPLATGALSGIGVGARKLKDVATGRDEIPVTKEIEDLVKGAGGRDEVVSAIERGKPLAAMPGVTDDVRPLIQSDSEALETLRTKLLEGRDTSIANTFKNILDDIDNINPKVGKRKVDENVVEYAERITKDNKNNATKIYESAKLNQNVPENLNTKLADIFADTRFGLLDGKRSIQGIRQADNKNEIFKINKDGSITPNSNLTLKSVEDLYIVLRDNIDKQDMKLIRGGDDAILTRLKNAIDDEVPELANARAAWNKTKDIDKAYNESKKLFGKEQEFTAYLNDIIDSGDDEILDAVRRGALKNIFDKRKSKTTLMSYIKSLDNDSADRRLLERLYPDDTFDDIARQIEDTTDFIYAQANVKDGPRTSRDIARQAAFAKNKKEAIDSMFGIFRKFFSDGDLTPAQQRRLVERILSDNPQITLQNIKDPKYETYLARLMQPAIVGTTAPISAEIF